MVQRIIRQRPSGNHVKGRVVSSRTMEATNGLNVQILFCLYFFADRCLLLFFLFVFFFYFSRILLFGFSQSLFGFYLAIFTGRSVNGSSWVAAVRGLACRTSCSARLRAGEHLRNQPGRPRTECTVRVSTSAGTSPTTRLTLFRRETGGVSYHIGRGPPRARRRAPLGNGIAANAARDVSRPCARRYLGQRHDGRDQHDRRAPRIVTGLLVTRLPRTSSNIGHR